jgi:hypothetical protein
MRRDVRITIVGTDAELDSARGLFEETFGNPGVERRLPVGNVELAWEADAPCLEVHQDARLCLKVDYLESGWDNPDFFMELGAPDIVITAFRLDRPDFDHEGNFLLESSMALYAAQRVGAPLMTLYFAAGSLFEIESGIRNWTRLEAMLRDNVRETDEHSLPQVSSRGYALSQGLKGILIDHRRRNPFLSIPCDFIFLPDEDGSVDAYQRANSQSMFIARLLTLALEGNLGASYDYVVDQEGIPNA